LEAYFHLKKQPLAAEPHRPRVVGVHHLVTNPVIEPPLIIECQEQVLTLKDDDPLLVKKVGL
jgi:hypothetical protein